jgi:hypothetical protein
MSRWLPSQSGSWLVAALLLPPVAAQSPAKDPYLAVHRSGGAAVKAGFEPDKTDVYLGEPVFLTFVLENEGAADFTFVVGGDYRGSDRPNSFRITAASVEGKAVRDPSPRGYDHMGGMSQVRTLAAGASYRERLFLPLWCAFDEPGEYVITCRRTLHRDHRRTAAPPVEVVTTWHFRVRPNDETQQGRLIDELGQHVGGTNTDERQDAVQRLAAMRDDRAIPHLAAAVARDEDRVALLAVRGLTQFRSDAAADALAIALRSRDDFVAGQAAAGLKAMGQVDRVVRGLLQNLGEGDPASRTAAAHALGSIRSPEASEPLARLLEQAATAGRGAEARTAAKALARVADPGTDPVLQACLNGPDFSLRLAAAKGLELSGRPIESQWLAPILRGRNDEHFHEAIRVLRIYGGPGSLRAILACVDLDNPRTDAPRTMYLLLAAEHMSGGPKLYYRWQSDPNRAGTPDELAANREVLAELRRWLESQK